MSDMEFALVKLMVIGAFFISCFFGVIVLLLAGVGMAGKKALELSAKHGHAPAQDAAKALVTTAAKTTATLVARQVASALVKPR